MYTLLLYIHVLGLVYWLGGDLGTYLSSRYVLRSELGVEARQTAFNILMACDMGPRLAMPIMLGTGCHLSVLQWPLVLPDTVAVVAWIVVSVWIGLIAAIHSNASQRWPALTHWDLCLRFGIAALLLAAGLVGTSLGLAGWVALKIAIFAALVASGIAVRFALKPFAIAYADMLQNGASDDSNNAMVNHMGTARRFVWLIWLGLFLNAALGLRVITL
jgi:hypothetical protein